MIKAKIKQIDININTIERFLKVNNVKSTFDFCFNISRNGDVLNCKIFWDGNKIWFVGRDFSGYLINQKAWVKHVCSDYLFDLCMSNNWENV